MTTPEPYEPEAIASVKAWFAEKSRSVYAVGPLLPTVDDPKSSAEEKKMSAKAQELDQFMDSVLASHGANSMLYVRVEFVFRFRINLMALDRSHLGLSFGLLSPKKSGHL